MAIYKRMQIPSIPLLCHKSLNRFEVVESLFAVYVLFRLQKDSSYLKNGSFCGSLTKLILIKCYTNDVCL